MKKVFVSGCYDILHGGHIEFFKQAKSIGDHLTVSFASEKVLLNHKGRRSSIPDAHKKVLLESIRYVDLVVVGDGTEEGLDFKEWFLNNPPDILVVTEDDRYGDKKRQLCSLVGCEYRVLPKTLNINPISTTEIIERIRAPFEAPLRVDFAGGWLDVPKYAEMIRGGYVVNCSIYPTVSLERWPYEKKSGLGGSGAFAILNGKNSIESELKLGAGWQDPAIIAETGLCVWNSGARPILHLKRNPEILTGLMGLYWTGVYHDTGAILDKPRDYAIIEKAGYMAKEAVERNSYSGLCAAVSVSYSAQLKEGMPQLPDYAGAEAMKYCGSGWGGYALYLFDSLDSRTEFSKNPGCVAVEPFIKNIFNH